MLVKLNQEQIKQAARVAFFEVIEKISSVKLSNEFVMAHLDDDVEVDFDSMAAFEKEIESLKFKFAIGEII